MVDDDFIKQYYVRQLVSDYEKHQGVSRVTRPFSSGTGTTRTSRMSKNYHMWQILFIKFEDRKYSL